MRVTKQAACHKQYGVAGFAWRPIVVARREAAVVFDRFFTFQRTKADFHGGEASIREGGYGLAMKFLV